MIQMKNVITLLLLCVVASSVQAAGFRVALQSAKQQGMGHVGVGLDTGPANIFFNPGAMALSESNGISINGSAVMPNVDYNMPGTTYQTSLEDNVGTPFAAYGSFNLSESIAGGIGVYTPYGNKVEWPDNWAGRYASQSVDLKSIFIQPTLSVALNDKFGIGAGFIYALGEVTLERGIPITTAGEEPDVTLETDGFANGMGYNVGAYYRPTDEISFGFNYRSKVEVEAEDGIVTTENIPTTAQPLFDATRFDATLPLPAEMAIGAGWEVTEKFTLAADLNYTFWNSYESLDFYFNGNLGDSNGNPAEPDVSVNSQDWEDSWTVKLGGDYSVNEKFALRAGGYYDFSPIPDENLAPITPDADRYGITGGFTFNPSQKFSIDGSILYINGEERTVLASESNLGLGQRYKNTAFAPALGINYSFN